MINLLTETQLVLLLHSVSPRERRLLWTAWYSFCIASIFSLTQHDAVLATITQKKSFSLKTENVHHNQDTNVVEIHGKILTVQFPREVVFLERGAA